MSYYTVHSPIMAKADIQEYFENKLGKQDASRQRQVRAAYAAMHKSMDESVGRIVDKIEALGKADKTIVVFTGDNGGDRHDACGGLRRQKGPRVRRGAFASRRASSGRQSSSRVRRATSRSLAPISIRRYWRWRELNRRPSSLATA